MTKHITHIIALLLLLSLPSCNRDKQEQHNGQGYMLLKLETSEQTVPGLQTTKAADPKYKVDILKSSGETVASYPDHTQLPPSVKLAAGKYKIKATSGDPLDVGYDKPCFLGQQESTINAGKESAVNITAQLNNVVFTMELDQQIIDGFTQADLIIYDSETSKKVFTITKDNVGKLAYLPVSSSYKWQLSMVNNQGTANSVYGELHDVVARNRFDFKFKVSTGSDNEGMLRLDITIDRDLIEFEHLFGVAITDDVPPTIAYEGNFIGGQPIMVNELKRDKEVNYRMTVPSRIKEVWLYHEIEMFDNEGIPRAVQLTGIDATMRNKLMRQGVEFSAMLIDNTEGYINFTNFCGKAPLGTYPMRFMLFDNVNHFLIEQVNIMVVPDQDHMALSADPWAKFATITAEWYTTSKPGGLTIQYRKEADQEWTKAPAETIVFDDENKRFSVKIKNLDPDTKYIYRTFSDEKEGAEFSFTTEPIVEIPNLDYQSWAFGNKQSGVMGRVDSWYPNSTATNYGSFWSTGNEGTAMTQAASISITYPEDDQTLGKKVVKMESIWIDAMFAKTFAAGNLFTGFFNVNTKNPIMSAKLGRPYQGRPLALKGKYKYTSTKINRNAGGGAFDKYIGQPDKGTIYIKLENWGNPNIKPEDFGDGNQPPGVTKVPVAYAEIVIDDSNEQWVDFEIKLDYKDLKTKPTHITMASSSSIYGENFCGGEGSTLWVSDFELVWTE